MAKKHAGKVIQMLSPENYIRKKARTLPIFECLVNPEWQNQGFANIVIARSHTNGNITACFFLVDTFCLGIKDTFFLFNVTQTEYREKLGSRAELEDYVKISYELAHNIVYAALEFAEEYGFKPAKDFTSTTQFMLEEDTDEIELIEIECGKNGKPLFVSGPNDDQAKINKVLAQLERTAGPGNFDYVTEEEFEEEWDDDEFEDDVFEEDEFQDFSLEEKKKLLIELESKKGKPNEEESLRYLKLTLSIFNEFKDHDLVDKYCEVYIDDLNIILHDDCVPEEMLGIMPGSLRISDEISEMFMEINDLAFESPRKASKLLDEFKKQTPNIPASYYLELNILLKKESRKYARILKDYAQKFPDYSLIKIMWMEYQLSQGNFKEKASENTYDRNYFFPGRTSIHVIEMFNYLIFKITFISRLNDPSHLEAIYYALHEIDFDENLAKVLESLILMAKMNFVFEHLKK